MSRYYPVLEVKQEWVLNSEWMGTKDKFWYRDPRTGRRWLFKYSRKGTGEHWAEKISGEVAALLNIDHATVELATIRDRRGSVSESFAETEEQLAHGNQLLVRWIDGYDGKKRFGQTDHTLDNILEVMENAFERSECKRRAKMRIAEYLVLDALVGNTDRHHENWGLLTRRVNDHFEDTVAPSYDHASSLGRELLDSRRVSLLSNRSVARYVERGRGAVYLSGDASRALSPLELVRRASDAYPEALQPVLRRIKSLQDGTLTDVVDGVPHDWMSRPARDFAVTMLCYTVKELRRLS